LIIFFWFFPAGDIIFLVPFYRAVAANMDPFQSEARIGGGLERRYFRDLDLFFYKLMNATFRFPEWRPKNLIILEVESMEQQVFGRYHQLFPMSMPFLCRIFRKGRPSLTTLS
jgi:hypothetical protein